MSEAEFDDAAAAIAVELDRVDIDRRVAAACRGSGNPAALAWLAEGLHLRSDTRAIDVGAARRVGTRLGLLDYCASASGVVRAGGSEFRPPAALEAAVEAAGWEVVQAVDLMVPPPVSWDEAAAGLDADIGNEARASEAEVVAAIESGRIAPRMLIAVRDERATSGRWRPGHE